MAQIIDGKKISSEIKEEIKIYCDSLKANSKQQPGLVTILVGKNPASQAYVNSKSKACKEVGMLSKIEHVDENISQNELIELINNYNSDVNYHGILVQLPLPKHIDENKIIESIIPEKDVDGFHPVNIGNLVIGKDSMIPCTPFGIIELLKRSKIETHGKHVVVVGRSNIVGKPIANLLLQKKDGANSIVTVVHSAAKNIEYYTKQADILIAAIGSPNYINDKMIKEEVVIIDVGINRVDDPSKEKGYRIVGDVDFDSVFEKASFITPVPGGVGPMTIAMLLKNTLIAYKKITNN